MSCAAQIRIGIVQIVPDPDPDVTPTFTADSGVRVVMEGVAARGEGQIDEQEIESPIPGGQRPVLGSYAETCTFQTYLYIPEEDDLSASHYLVRLLRACGCPVAIDDNEAVVDSPLGVCLDTDVLPVAIRWTQRNGVVRTWRRCVGSFGIEAETSGNKIRFNWEMHGDPVAPLTESGALPTVTYPAQDGQPLTARNVTYDIGGSSTVDVLYSWSLVTGISAEDVSNQLTASGLGASLVALSGAARWEQVIAARGAVTVGLYTGFREQTAFPLIEIAVAGQSSDGTEILSVLLPEAYPDRQELEEEAGQRALAAPLLLKPGPDFGPWRIVVREQEVTA